MAPTSAGRDERRFPDKFSSVSEVMSHKAAGKSGRVLFDRLRLLSLQNLETDGEGGSVGETGGERAGRRGINILIPRCLNNVGIKNKRGEKVF